MDTRGRGLSEGEGIGAGERGDCALFLAQLRSQRFQHALHVLQDVRVPEAKHTIALSFQPYGATPIRLRLPIVLPAVELHDQPVVDAEEVHEVGPNRHLATELVAVEASGAQAPPQGPLCIRGFSAEVSGTRDVSHGR